MLPERYVQCALSDMCRWLHHELWTREGVCINKCVQALIEGALRLCRRGCQELMSLSRALFLVLLAWLAPERVAQGIERRIVLQAL
jgi:hypothetical protein